MRETSGSAIPKNSPSGLNKVTGLEWPRAGLSRLRLLSSAFRRRSRLSAVFYFPNLNSTNSRAWALVDGGAPDRSLVITPRQTAGRGRGMNRWWSGAGSLTFSVIRHSRERNPGDPASAISLVTGLALARAIRSIDAACPVGVKWPNDLYARGRKLGGILVESRVRAGRIQQMVVGVGINVNSPMSSATAAIRRTAVSLVDLTGRRWDESRLLEKMLRTFVEVTDDFSIRGFAPFLEKWKEYDAIPTGSAVVLTEGRIRFHGFYEGIHPTGALHLRDTSGRTHSFFSGTLRLSP